MRPAGSTGPEYTGRLRAPGIWVAPLAVLFGVWLWMAFSSGGYLARQWLPAGLVLGLFGLVVASLVVYPRRPRQLSLAVLTLFGLYAVWVAASALWADSTSRVWLETARTFALLLVFALALIFLTIPMTRKIFRYLLMTVAFILLATCIWRLWSAGSITAFFVEQRYIYPVGYTNDNAALFLVGFWPLMWLAAGPEEKAPVRGLALGIATGLFGLALLTQSRGAIWSLAITLVLTLIVSPARLRTLFYLVVPGLLTVYAFPRLNLYWTDGPDAVAGGVGARALLVASLTAAFIGMILALLERWIRVSRRMKVIFGIVIFSGIAAAVIYGSISLTSEVGGPRAWISQTWKQFTGPTQGDSENTTRLIVVSSSGRVDLWKVAWREFESSPVLGVGADNFVFQYDRFKTIETLEPQQAHSLVLQVLGETGIVGGVFAIGGMILALGGLLWPRCAAGWLGARQTWMRRRTNPADTVASGASSQRNSRWGNNSLDYGWGMAIFTGIVYWLIHASVDWLWQMAGVAIPMLLLLAAGIAGVDGRVDIIWPRLSRWLQFRLPEGARTESNGDARGETTGQEIGVVRRIDKVQETDANQAQTFGTGQEERLLLLARRSEKHLLKRTRRQRKLARTQRNALRFQPPGMLSLTFRILLLTLAFVVIVLAGLPYLSLQYQDSALSLARTNGVRAAARAETAHWLQPSDPAPYVTQARIYSSAASTSASSAASDRTGAVLDNLALCIRSFEKAIEVEPADWTIHYRAGVAAINLLLASECATGAAPALDYTTLIQTVPGLEDWSSLSYSATALPDPGVAADSLAKTPAALQAVADYRSLSLTELRQRACEFLEAAKERNPLAPEVTEARTLICR